MYINIFFARWHNSLFLRHKFICDWEGNKFIPRDGSKVSPHLAKCRVDFTSRWGAGNISSALVVL